MINSLIHKRGGNSTSFFGISNLRNFCETTKRLPPLNLLPFPARRRRRAFLLVTREKVADRYTSVPPVYHPSVRPSLRPLVHPLVQKWIHLVISGRGGQPIFKPSLKAAGPGGGSNRKKRKKDKNKNKNYPLKKTTPPPLGSMTKKMGQNEAKTKKKNWGFWVYWGCGWGHLHGSHPRWMSVCECMACSH